MASGFELLQRFPRHGEQAAFTDMVRRHLDLVFATALRKVADPGAAQEIAQNVFAALAHKACRFAPDDSLPAWRHCWSPNPGERVRMPNGRKNLVRPSPPRRRGTGRRGQTLTSAFSPQPWMDYGDRST